MGRIKLKMNRTKKKSVHHDAAPRLNGSKTKFEKTEEVDEKVAAKKDEDSKAKGELQAEDEAKKKEISDDEREEEIDEPSEDDEVEEEDDDEDEEDEEDED